MLNSQKYTSITRCIYEACKYMVLMDKRTYHTLDAEKRLEIAAKILYATFSKQDILAELATFGYGREKLEEGFNLHVKADSSISRTTKNEASFKEVEEKFNNIMNDYYKIYDLTKLAFKSTPEIFSKFGLKDAPAHGTRNFMMKIESFYNILLSNPFLLTPLNSYEITKEKIELKRKESKAAVQEYLEYITSIGTTPYDDNIKEEKMLALDNWMDEFLSVIDIALRYRPDLQAEITL